MELSPAWVSATAAVFSIVIVVSSMLIKEAFSTRDQEIKSVKATQVTLFNKHDAVVEELHEYKLHVAERYVNRDILREQLDPINRSLEEIKSDLRDERKHQ